MSQSAFDALRAVEIELSTVNELLDQRRADPACKSSDRAKVDAARAQTEKTYLLRLLAEFEGALARLGPNLSVPVAFTIQDGLGTKLDRIGKNMRMIQTFRDDCDDRLREHRNELAHGRSPIPRVSFDSSHQLMKTFLRHCF